MSVDGDDDAKRKAVLTAFALLNHRISLFASLPIAKLDAMSLKKELDEIGRMRENGE